MERLTFVVPKMDCGAEEQLIRMQLTGHADVVRVVCDLGARTVEVVHSGDSATIEQALASLNLGASLVSRETVETVEPDADDRRQRRLLVVALAINAAMFAIELALGFVAQSMGLVADSLDMLADALVYGLSLYAVGSSSRRKRVVARLSGWFQLLLAALGMAEVARRFIGAGDEPNFALMIGVSLLALAGNVVSLLVLLRSRSQDAHIQASQIFTSNDVLVNVGVILAGVLVYATTSKVPDLLIGAVVFVLVAYGALRILKLAHARAA